MKPIQEVEIIKPKEENLYSEREILEAWNEVGQSHNGLTLSWIFQKLREKRLGKDKNIDRT